MSSDADLLDELRWKHRVLLLDFPEGSKDQLKSFERQIKSSREAIKERDLVLYHLGELGQRNSGYSRKISEKDRLALRGRLKLSAPSTSARVILIGKDGGIKATQTANFDLVKLFKLIDTMPRRKKEMKEEE